MTTSAHGTQLRRLPGIDTLLEVDEVKSLAAAHGLALVTHAVRTAVERARTAILDGNIAPDSSALVRTAARLIESIVRPSLKPVINATGIVLHTNLGRAPLGKAVLDEISPVILGYSNLEYDLEKGSRGERGGHCAEITRYLTRAEDAVLVNNNAAAIILILSTLARKKEVIVSRGELIEIGGAFRIPEIMAAAGCKMVEVGTTNRTRLSDYEKAITDKTSILFKAHKSNYAMTGFVEEASVAELAGLARAKNLVVVYDIGSGLIRKPSGMPLSGEPDVASGIAEGADLVCFSGDKLLGGPQAGIVAGRAELVRRLARAPLMRALRPGKLTIAALAASLRTYLADEKLKAGNPAFAMLSTPLAVIENRAARLAKQLAAAGVRTEIVDSSGQCGGGTLPDLQIPSKAVALAAPESFAKHPDKFAGKIFKKLSRTTPPVVGVLREGKILFDLLTVFDDEVESAAKAISDAVYNLEKG